MKSEVKLSEKIENLVELNKFVGTGISIIILLVIIGLATWLFMSAMVGHFII